jgi:hypothetical protein
MTTPNLGAILLDAAKTDLALIWTNWPTWSHDQPILWIFPALIAAGFVRSVWPKKRRTR